MARQEDAELNDLAHPLAIHRIARAARKVLEDATPEALAELRAAIAPFASETAPGVPAPGVAPAEERWINSIISSGQSFEMVFRSEEEARRDARQSGLHVAVVARHFIEVHPSAASPAIQADAA